MHGGSFNLEESGTHTGIRAALRGPTSKFGLCMFECAAAGFPAAETGADSTSRPGKRSFPPIVGSGRAIDRDTSPRCPMDSSRFSTPRPSQSPRLIRLSPTRTSGFGRIAVPTPPPAPNIPTRPVAAHQPRKPPRSWHGEMSRKRGARVPAENDRRHVETVRPSEPPALTRSAARALLRLLLHATHSLESKDSHDKEVS